MATVKEITTMCKAGQVQEAYELAKADLELYPTNPWVHREMAWALNPVNANSSRMKLPSFPTPDLIRRTALIIS